VGAGIVLLGLGLGAGAISIPSEAGYGGVGPNFLPWVVAVVLVVCGIFIVREARTGGFRNMDAPSGAEQAWWPGWPGCRPACSPMRRSSPPSASSSAARCATCWRCRACAAPAGRPASAVPRRWRRRLTGLVIAAPVFWMFTKLPGDQPAGPHRHRLALKGHAPMDILNALLHGFAVAITPANLLWALVGCALGTAVGVLPGIGPAVAVAMLLPITAKVEITSSMIFFAGIYYGAMYGGSTTSILLNTPGETASMVTAMEGNKMAKSGRAGAALATAAIGSFVAGHHRDGHRHAVRALRRRLRRAARPARVLPADGAGLHHGERGARARARCAA
jgi:hypothetical protein